MPRKSNGSDQQRLLQKTAALLRIILRKNRILKLIMIREHIQISMLILDLHIRAIQQTRAAKQRIRSQIRHQTMKVGFKILVLQISVLPKNTVLSKISLLPKI